MTRGELLLRRRVMMIFRIIVQLISGLASPVIFVPSFAIGWFARRWWLVLLGATVVAVLSEAEFMLIEAPEAELEWGAEPLVLVPPLLWCAAGSLTRAWYRRVAQHRQGGPIRGLPVVTGMVLGGLGVGALALGVGLLYLHTDQLDVHTIQHSPVDGSSAYETIFFEYLFPGTLMGQLAGGLIGRVFGRQIAPQLGQQP